MTSAIAKREISKAILITGCSSGIGKATALRLAKSGHTVWATARKKESLAELEAAGCRTLALDVDDEASMDGAVRTIEAVHGAIGVLINNAGYSQSGAIEAVPMERVRKQFEKGPLARLAGESEDVARIVEKAITTKRPRARYTVSASAKLLLTQRALLSDRMWDAMLRASFPSPGA